LPLPTPAQTRTCSSPASGSYPRFWRQSDSADIIWYFSHRTWYQIHRSCLPIIAL